MQESCLRALPAKLFLLLLEIWFFGANASRLGRKVGTGRPFVFVHCRIVGFNRAFSLDFWFRPPSPIFTVCTSMLCLFVGSNRALPLSETSVRYSCLISELFYWKLLHRFLQGGPTCCYCAHYDFFLYIERAYLMKLWPVFCSLSARLSPKALPFLPYSIVATSVFNSLAV